jgi:hypothetical protein
MMTISAQIISATAQVISATAIILGILLIAVIVLDITKVIKVSSPIVVYLFLSIFPILMLVVPAAILYSHIYSLHEKSIIVICVLEIFILAVYVIIKFDISPISNKRIENTSTRLKCINSGRQLLHYSIYGSIIYSVPILALISYFFYCVKTSQFPFSKLFMYLNDLLLMGQLTYLTEHSTPVFYTSLDPFSDMSFVIIASIIISEILIPACLVLIISMNGTIRLICSSKRIRRRAAVYIIMLVFPITNLICMFKLCSIVKGELKNRAAQPNNE